MSLLKMYSPQLLLSKDGQLFLQITHGGVSVVRPTPADLQSYDQAALEAFFNTVVPPMIEELKALRKDKLKKIKRKDRNETQKRRGHPKRGDSGANGGVPPTSNGADRI